MWDIGYLELSDGLWSFTGRKVLIKQSMLEQMLRAGKAKREGGEDVN